jgi:hypothetical protein
MQIVDHNCLNSYFFFYNILDTPTIQDRAPCNHSCMNKRFCRHDCCRNGVITKTRKIQQVTHPVHKEIKRNNSLNNFMSDLKSKMSYFPETPSTKRLKVCRLHVGLNFKLNIYQYKSSNNLINKI